MGGRVLNDDHCVCIFRPGDRMAKKDERGSKLGRGEGERGGKETV